jgi:iron(III) transport system permease protein
MQTAQASATLQRSLRALLGAPLGLATAATWIAVAPLAALVVFALVNGDGGETARLARTRLPEYLIQSALVSGLSTLGVTAIGGALGWLVAVHRFPGRSLFDWMLVLPLAAPAYVLAYAYSDLTSAAGPLQSALRDATGWTTGAYVFPHIRGVGGAAFVFSLALYPYVYLLARRAFAAQAGTLAEAARTLGRSPWGVLKDVAIPLARPALVAGAALTVMETLADYGTVAHLGASTLTVGVMRAWASVGEPAAAARIALVLLVVCAGALAIEKASRGRARIAPSSRSERPQPPRPLQGWRGWAAAAACGGVLVLALGVPALRLGWLALEHGARPEIGRAAVTSLLLAGGAAALAAAIALGVALAARLKSKAAQLGLRVVQLGYAAPGAVAALGALALFGAFQAGLNAAWGGAAPILLVGGVPALLIAYQTRFAAAALGPVTAALERVTPALDDAARTLGATPRELAARVHLPLASAGVASAALLVFVEVLKELPATMILRPFDFDTLAVIAHGYAADERLGNAAAPALLLAAVALPPMILAARALARDPRARS